MRGVQKRPGKHKPRKRYWKQTSDPGYVTSAGPVKVTRADGTVEIQPPLGAEEYRALVKTRLKLTGPTMLGIRRRDRDTCRYCGDIVGPFEIDHVVPVAMGGTNRRGNLVLACRPCNSRKGTATWVPRPIR
jgi:hypothetical protein